jgi:hypothetical protein
MRKPLPAVSGLPLLADFPEPVLRVRVADRGIAARFQPEQNNAAVSAIAQPLEKFALGLRLQLRQGHGIWVAERIENVGHFSVFRRPVRIDDIPEGLRFWWRRLGSNVERSSASR